MKKQFVWCLVAIPLILGGCGNDDVAISDISKEINGDYKVSTESVVTEEDTSGAATEEVTSSDVAEEGTITLVSGKDSNDITTSICLPENAEVLSLEENKVVCKIPSGQQYTFTFPTIYDVIDEETAILEVSEWFITGRDNEAFLKADSKQSEVFTDDKSNRFVYSVYARGENDINCYVIAKDFSNNFISVYVSGFESGSFDISSICETINNSLQ